MVAADLMEFSRSTNQFEYLIVIMNSFTCGVELKIFKKVNGKTVVQALKDLVIFCWDTQDYLLTGISTKFVNRDLKQALENYGIQHMTTFLYHPQADSYYLNNDYDLHW